MFFFFCRASEPKWLLVLVLVLPCLVYVTFGRSFVERMIAAG